MFYLVSAITRDGAGDGSFGDSLSGDGGGSGGEGGRVTFQLSVRWCSKTRASI
jgi:hypothetical protein